MSDLTYCTISTSSRGWRTSWSFALSSRDAHTPRWRRVKVERQQPCFLARDWYEIVSSGPKVSSSARASSSGIVVLSYGGVQSRRQCWWGVHYAPVCTTRPCTLVAIRQLPTLQLIRSAAHVQRAKCQRHVPGFVSYHQSGLIDPSLVFTPQVVLTQLRL